MKKVYYAHSMHLYNTPQEKRDIELLEQLGFEVINPSCEKISSDYLKWLQDNNIKSEDKMEWFKNLIDEVDVVAYRSHVDLKIPSGVLFEIKYAQEKDKLIFELPTFIQSREMSAIETKEYLHYNGQR